MVESGYLRKIKVQWILVIDRPVKIAWNILKKQTQVKKSFKKSRNLSSRQSLCQWVFSWLVFIIKSLLFTIFGSGQKINVEAGGHFTKGGDDDQTILFRFGCGVLPRNGKDIIDKLKVVEVQSTVVRGGQELPGLLPHVLDLFGTILLREPHPGLPIAGVAVLYCHSDWGGDEGNFFNQIQLDFGPGESLDPETNLKSWNFAK